MPRLDLPLCWFNRHAPIRDRAKWDGTHFVSKCRFCGTAIRRRTTRQWHKDWKPDHTNHPAWL
jgi:hypothetical protein